MPHDRLDSLGRLYLSLEEAANVNTHQMVVLDGPLDIEALARALRRTVLEFPMLLSGVDANGFLQPRRWDPVQIPVVEREYSGKIDFGNPAFRGLLMTFDREHPLRWRERPPMQLLHVTSPSGLSAVMFNVHHGAADAWSDVVLLARLMETYGEVEAGHTPAPPEPPPDVVDFDRVVRREMRADRARLEWATLVGRYRDTCERSRGYAGPPLRDGARTLDFCRSRLTAEQDASIRRVATRGGVSINTVFTAALYRVLQAAAPADTRTIRIVCPASVRRHVAGLRPATYQNLTVPYPLRLRAGHRRDETLLADIQDQVRRMRDGDVFACCTRVDSLARLLALPGMASRAISIVGFFQRTNVGYSNPGRIRERFSRFGRRRVLDYMGFGCLTPPLDVMLYTPEVEGRLELSAVFDTRRFPDVERQLLRPLVAALERMDPVPGQ